jgi:hypothetical protein
LKMEEQAEEKLVRPANKATTNKYYLQKFDAAISSVCDRMILLCGLLHIWISVPVYVLLDIYALPSLVTISPHLHLLSIWFCPHTSLSLYINYSLLL